MTGTTKDHGKRYTQWLRVALVVALFGCLFVCSACRFTDELTEFTYDPAYGAVNDQFDPEYREVNGAPEDHTRVSAIERPSTNYALQEVALPTYDPDAPEGAETKKRIYDSESASELVASEGTLPDINDALSGMATTDQTTDNGSGKNEKSESMPNDDPANGDVPVDGDGNSGEAGDGQRGGDDSTGGPGGKGVVYEDGAYEDLPENTQCVAACGQYALIVQMLAGKGGLVATDQATLTSMLAAADKGVFSYSTSFAYDPTHEGLTSVVAAWSGDGTDESSLNVESLLKAFEPWTSKGQVCVVLTDGVSPKISEEQKQVLSDAGVSVRTVPLLGKSDTSDEMICKAVSIVGELLRNSRSQYPTSDMASLYVSMREGELKKCVSANGDKYAYKAGYAYLYKGSAGGTPASNLKDSRVSTAYVAEWVPASGTLMKGSQLSGGVSGLPLYRDGQPVLVSGIAASDKTGGGFALIDYYLQHAGVVNNAYDEELPRSQYRIIPGTVEGIEGITSHELKKRLYNGSALSYASDGSYTWCKLGDAAFPALIVASDDIASQLEQSANNVVGLYNMGQPYRIHVVPSGLSGSWASGTVESYLVATWTLCNLRSADASLLANATADFYNAFYRCEPSGASTNYQRLISDYDNARTTKCPTG